VIARINASTYIQFNCNSDCFNRLYSHGRSDWGRRIRKLCILCRFPKKGIGYSICLFSYYCFHCFHFPIYWRLYIKKIRQKIGDSKMKKSIIALFSVLLIVVLAACGGSDDTESAEPDEDGVTKLVVG